MHTACTGKRGDAADRRAHGHLAGRPISSTSTAPARSRAAGSAVRIAYSTRSSPGPITAGWPSTTATSRTPPATPRRPGARARRGRARAAVRRRRPGDARPGSRGSRARCVRPGGGGHASPRRGHRGCARGRRDDPDLQRLGVLHPRLAPARPFSTTSGPSSGATGSPSSPTGTGAATCSPSAGPTTARCTSGGAGGGRGDRAGGRGRGLRRTRARRGWPAALIGLAELRRRQGRLEEADELLDGPAPSSRRRSCRARLALDRGESLRAVELLERVLRQQPADRAAGSLPRARAARPRPRSPAASSTRQRRASRRCGRSSGSSARRRCGPAPTSPKACSPPPRGDHERARPLLEDAVDRFDRSGGPFDAARPDRARNQPRRPRARRRGPARGRTALDRLVELGADARPERARRLLDASTRRDGGRPSPELTPREREVLALLAEGLTNRQIASDSWSASTPSTATSPTSCASSTCRRGRQPPPTPCAQACSSIPSSQSLAMRDRRRWPVLAKSTPSLACVPFAHGAPQRSIEWPRLRRSPGSTR